MDQGFVSAFTPSETDHMIREFIAGPHIDDFIFIVVLVGTALAADELGVAEGLTEALADIGVTGCDGLGSTVFEEERFFDGIIIVRIGVFHQAADLNISALRGPALHAVFPVDHHVVNSDTVIEVFSGKHALFGAISAENSHFIAVLHDLTDHGRGQVCCGDQGRGGLTGESVKFNCLTDHIGNMLCIKVSSGFKIDRSTLNVVFFHTGHEEPVIPLALQVSLPCPTAFNFPDGIFTVHYQLFGADSTIRLNGRDLLAVDEHISGLSNGTNAGFRGTFREVLIKLVIDQGQ